MANTLLTISMVTKRAMFHLSNQLIVAREVYKGYNTLFADVQGGFRIGSSATVALPNKYRSIAGPDITNSIADVTERSRTVSVDIQRSIPVQFTQTDLSLSLADFAYRFIEPATIQVADYIDQQVYAEYTNIYNELGTAGTVASTHSAIDDVRKRFTNEAVPSSPRFACLSPSAYGAMATGPMTGLFNQSMVDTLVREGFRGRFSTFDFYETASFQTLTTGTRNRTAGQVKTQPAQNATSIALKTYGNAETIKKGEIFTIATVVGVNPISGNVWEDSTLRQFVVTADATADAGGDVTVNVSPAIISSAAATNLLPHQTVNDIPLVNDAITFTGTLSTAYSKNLFFHPNAFALTMVPIAEIGPGVEQTTVSDKLLGLSITYSNGGNILTHVGVRRLDVLFGVDTIRPELAARLTN